MLHNDLFEQGPDNKWRIKTSLSGLVSTLNSTSTALGSNGIFTGAFEEITNFAFFTLCIFANQDSANNGLEFQWSTDGINADRIESTTVNANVGRAFTITVRARYFRIKYINGSIAQSTFRLGVVYHSSGTGLITKPLDGSVTTENFAQLTQSPIMGLSTTGSDFKNINVITSGGVNRLATDAAVNVSVNELLGQDAQASTYFYINSQYDIGNIAVNDTVRVQIAAGANATLFPAVDVTTTVTSTETTASNPERALADKIVTTLNNNSNFNLNWKAERIKDFSGVFIASKLFNEWGERTNAGDFSVTTTGTTTVTIAYTDIMRRAYPTELARSPNDPRRGILAIAGTVSTIPGGIGDLFIENAKNAGSSDLRVNGSSTNITFTISADATKTIYLNELRFYGGANSIKFEQFLGKNVALTNGILVEIKSDNQINQLPIIKTTEDFKNKFAFGTGANMRIDIQAGADQFMATFLPDFAIVLRKQGYFGSGNDDYVKVVIRDDLTTGANELEFISRGFLKED